MFDRIENPLYRFTLTYGLALGTIFFMVLMLVYFMGNPHLPGDKASMINSMLLIFSMMVLGRKYRNEEYEGVFTYGKALSFLMLLVTISAFTYAVLGYFYYKVINPEAIQYYIQQIEIGMSRDMNFSDDKVAMFSDMYKTYLGPGAMAFAMFFNQVLFGGLLALLNANFIKTPFIGSLPDNKV